MGRRASLPSTPEREAIRAVDRARKAAEYAARKEVLLQRVNQWRANHPVKGRYDAAKYRRYYERNQLRLLMYAQIKNLAERD